MTKQQIALVQQSFARLEHDKARFGARFLARLCALDRRIAARFAEVDMDAHVRKLVAAVSQVVRGLPHRDTLAARLVRLGAQHAGYALSRADYGTTGRALLLTLAEFLEDIWSVELLIAWNAAFTLVSEFMLAGAKAAGAQQSV